DQPGVSVVGRLAADDGLLLQAGHGQEIRVVAGGGGRAGGGDIVGIAGGQRHQPGRAGGRGHGEEIAAGDAGGGEPGLVLGIDGVREAAGERVQLRGQLRQGLVAHADHAGQAAAGDGGGDVHAGIEDIVDAGGGGRGGQLGAGASDHQRRALAAGQGDLAVAAVADVEIHQLRKIANQVGALVHQFAGVLAGVLGVGDFAVQGGDLAGERVDLGYALDDLLVGARNL